MKKTLLLLFVLISITQAAHAQNGASIGASGSTNDPSTSLDLTDNNVGLSLNNVTLTSTTDAATITLPKLGLLIFNPGGTLTKGFWYNSGTTVSPVWRNLLDNSTGWSTTGNSGTTASTATIGSTVNNNFIGTTDNTDFVFATNGLERGRFFSTGQFSVGSRIVGAKFEVHQTTGTSVARFITYNNPNDIELRRTAGTQNAPTATNANSIVGRFLGVGYDGANWRNTGSISFEVESNVSSTSSPGRIVFSTTPTGSVTLTERMRIDNAGNVGINKVPIYKFDVENGSDRSYFHAGTAGSTESYVTLARSNWEAVNAFAFNDDAIQGVTSNSSYKGVNGINSNLNGDAVWGENTAAAAGGGGAGVVGLSSQSGAGGAGVWGENSNTSGTGIVGAGQNQAGSFLVAGSGGAFTGNTTGVYAYNTSCGVGEAIYTVNGLSGVGGCAVVCRVNYWDGTTQYKILGSGTVSTTAEDLNGNRVVLHAPETPEIYFQDYGNGKLQNGKVHIELDPIFAKNIVVDSDHPLQAFVQLNGDCNGVYITNRTQHGFDVVELQNGTSNVEFTWTVTANRADEVLPGGKVSKNADIRFEPAPLDEPTAAVKKQGQQNTKTLSKKELKKMKKQQP